MKAIYGQQRHVLRLSEYSFIIIIIIVVVQERPLCLLTALHCPKLLRIQWTAGELSCRVADRRVVVALVKISLHRRRRQLNQT